MRQKDYEIGRARRLQAKRKRLMQTAVLFDAPDEILLRSRKRYRSAKSDVRRICARSFHISSTTFNINVFSEEECLRNFRFLHRDLGRVALLTNWTTGSTERNRYKCDPFTATCIMLKRLSFPSRWKDLEHIFGMRASALCEVFWEVVESFVEARKHLLEVFRSGLMGRRAEIYSAAIKERGAPLENCVGFIDCTKIQMSRPGGSGAIQRSCFSGHKRFHCLVYQTVTTPDGLMFNLYGPEVGRRHDMTLYRESNLDAVLQEALLVDGRQYCIFGDSAYVLKPWLQTAFPRVGSTSAQEAYNTAMSMMREAVEWTYKDLKQIWTSQDFKRQLKVLQSPIALLYKSSALLWNFRTCLTRGGQVVSYFNCSPPTLAEYLADE